MNVTLDYLISNRKWLIRDYHIWGYAGNFEADMFMTETDSPVSRVVFLQEFVGGAGQIVEFADLLDHRGNRLPSSINNAEIILIPKNAISAFVLGTAGPASFRVARAPQQAADAIVDLLIMEMN